MLKNISNLEGAHKLTKNELKMISAGAAPLCEDRFCAEVGFLDGKWVWRCMPC